jgi:GNAT superfamily N-acetyltransferase
LKAGNWNNYFVCGTFRVLPVPDTIIGSTILKEKLLTGIVIRHAHIEDCPSLAKIIIEATQDAFRGRVPDYCLKWLTPEESVANWAKNFKAEQSLKDGMCLYAAETKSSGVIGFAMLCPLEPNIAHSQFIDQGYFHELRSLQVIPAWQKRGIGKQLIAKVADQVAVEGGACLLVKMLVDNPNMGYYEHLGAARLNSNPFVWEGYETKEIIYGWDNLKILSSTA